MGSLRQGVSPTKAPRLRLSSFEKVGVNAAILEPKEGDGGRHGEFDWVQSDAQLVAGYNAHLLGIMPGDTC